MILVKRKVGCGTGRVLFKYLGAYRRHCRLAYVSGLEGAATDQGVNTGHSQLNNFRKESIQIPN